jgi:hypothetical protein
VSTIDIRYSKDGGRNWSDFRSLDMGSTGDFLKEVQTRSLGMGREWIFDIRVTDPVRADLMAASIMAEQTDS